MELRNSMNNEDVEGWISRNVAHTADQKIDFHFHELEEWVEVLDGSITFRSAGEQPFHVDKGKVLRIPQGEVHRVEIGGNGVLYRMWLPAEVSPAAFSRRLDRDDLEIIKTNLRLPLLENERDAGRRNATAGQPGGAIAEALLAAFVSEELSFRTAGGQTIGKRRYLDRKPSHAERKPGGDGAVCILHKCPECLFLSTIVDVQQGQGASTESYMNLRLFGRQQDEWRCRTWMNFKV
jgi:hypothetical protein